MSNLIKKSLTVSNGNAVGKSCGQRGTEASEPVICCHWAIFWLALWSLLNKFISMAGTAANSFKAAGCVNCHTRGSQLTRKARMLFIAYRIVASRSTSWLVTPHVTNWMSKNKSCPNELKFCEDSWFGISWILTKFQLIRTTFYFLTPHVTNWIKIN